MSPFPSDPPAFVGIDPGKSGGIATITHDGLATAWRMPKSEQDLWALLSSICRDTPVALERVHAMPGNGVASMFAFGQGYGTLRGMITAAGGEIVDVRPQKWQKDLDCLTGGDKNVSKRRAIELFPGVKPITHATADALLIAEWLRRFGGESLRNLGKVS